MRRPREKDVNFHRWAQDVRWEKISFIKALIAAGEYETEEKLETAAERLQWELMQGGRLERS